MNGTPVKQRVKKHFDRMKDMGMKRVQIWMPVELEQQLRIIADALKDGKEVVIKEASCEGGDTPKQD